MRAPLSKSWTSSLRWGTAKEATAARRLGLPAQGPTAVITDLGILTPDPGTRELTLTSVHPGVSVDKVVKSTGWPLKVAAEVAITPPPTETELRVLRDLNERTARAHAEQA